ncbi:hypothetical protein ACYZTL_25525 [Pseudomonas sp. LB3P81]
MSWPRNQLDQLIRIGDSGLYMSRENKLYADIKNTGIGRIEPNANGVYALHFPFAPDRPGPMVKKTRGKPQWVVSSPAPDAQGPSTSSQATHSTVRLLDPSFTRLLPPPDDEGIRRFKSRSFVDIQGEGIVMVRRNADEHLQETTPTELNPSGPVLEKIEGTTSWRRMSTTIDQLDDGPGPSKRRRIDPEPLDHSTDSSPQELPQIFPSDLINPNAYLWASWGKVEKPASTESIQIGDLHYQVVHQGKYPPASIVYLQNPKFAPSRFENFENMLLDTPALQPVPAVLNGHQQWEVQAKTYLFDKPMTQSVADAFNDFTEVTSTAVARQLFVRSGDSEVIAQDGLYTTSVTLHHWKNASGLPDLAFENPLDLLPVAPRADNAGQVIPVQPLASTDPLQRLDFSLSRYQTEWARFSATPSDGELRLLVSSILRGNGYDVFPLGEDHRLPKLVFKREFHEKIYFMKLGKLQGDNIKPSWTPGSELSAPNLENAIGRDALSALQQADAQGNVVWLLGGLKTTGADGDFVFILRER